FYYKKWEHDEEVTYSGKIPSNWIKEIEPLPMYRKKKDLSFPASYDWLGVAKQMDQILPQDEAGWEARVKPITLQSLEGESLFTYTGTNHIAGGLASGKSTFRSMNTFWLVKEKQAKVGIIENSVSEVLEQVKHLRKLGLKVVPVIGRSNRHQHFINTLESNR